MNFFKDKTDYIKIRIDVLSSFVVIEEILNDNLIDSINIHLDILYDDRSKKTVRADHLSVIKLSIFKLIILRNCIVGDDEMIDFTAVDPYSIDYMVVPKGCVELRSLDSPLTSEEFNFFENDVFVEFEGFQKVFPESKNQVLWCWLSKSSNYKWYRHVNFDDFSLSVKIRK